jgi:uncharacterized protein (TIGR04222 family)
MDGPVIALNPLDWSGGPFLTLYFALVALTIFGIRKACADAGPFNAARPPALGPLEIAYLAGGTVRAADTLIVWLLQVGAAGIDEKGRKITIETSEAALPADMSMITPWFDGECTREEIRWRASDILQRLRTRLAAGGLVATSERIARFRWIAACALGAVIVFGLMKLQVGIGRGRPVGILVAFLIATVPVGILGMAGLGHPTLAGQAALRESRDRHARASRAPQRHELALAFAIAGPAVLIGTPFEAFGKRISNGSPGCGTGCSGGGDGGGHGGNGCGGCSGGH